MQRATENEKPGNNEAREHKDESSKQAREQASEVEAGTTIAKTQ